MPPHLGVAAPQSASFVERWYVLIMMCLVYTLSIADRYVVSTVLDPIRRELHLTDAGIAFLTGLAAGVLLRDARLPAVVAHRSQEPPQDHRRLPGAWSFMTTLCGLAHTTGQFFLARVGVGVGEAGGTPGASSLLSDYFPASRRAMALTVFSLGAPIGAWLGYNVAGMIADHYGWRVGVLCARAPRRAGRPCGVAHGARAAAAAASTADDDAATPSFMTTMRFLWQQRSAVHLMIGSAMCALWGWGLMYWTPGVPAAHLPHDARRGGRRDRVRAPVGRRAGDGGHRLADGAARHGRFAAHRVAARGRHSRSRPLASGVIFYTHDLALAKAMFWIYIPAIYFYIGPCFGLLNNLAQCRMRAMFCATTLFLANVGNLVIAPPLIGGLSDWFAPDHVSNAASLRLAMLCLVPTGLWATVHYFISARDIRKDQLRARSFPF